MSYDQAKRIQIWEKTWTFSGWYVDNSQNLYLWDNQSPYLRNARLDWNSIIIRPWHQLFATLTAWDYPRWIWSYLRTSSANDRIIVRHNTDATHKLYTITEAWVATSILTAWNIASDNRMFFQNIWDDIYCMNWSDVFWKLNWTTYTTPATWVASFAPSFSVVFNGCHWASGRSSNPNKVYKSVWDNYEDFNSAWSDQFTFQETITWLSANNEALFYFTKSSISITWSSDISESSWTITYFTRALEVKEWAVNNASIIEVWNKVYFLTPSNKISLVTRWQSFDWYEVMELSERKYKWISTIMWTLDNDQSDSFGYFLPKENLIKWFVKSSWASFNDVCIIYDISKDSFLIDNNKYFYDWVFFKWKNYTISMIEPKVYQDEYWQDDEWAWIAFEYRTKEFYLSDVTYKKILWETRTLLDINEIANLYQEIWVDWALFDSKLVDKNNIEPTYWWIWVKAIWENAVWEWWDQSDEYNEIYILRTKWNLNVIWRKFQFRFRENTVAAKVRLKHIQMKIEFKPELATNLTT